MPCIALSAWCHSNDDIDTGASCISDLERNKAILHDGDDGLWEELAHAAGDPAMLPHHAARDPKLLAIWCRAALQRAARDDGFDHLAGLPADQQLSLARVLLHAATCHYYAVEDAWPLDSRCFQALSACAAAISDADSPEALLLRTLQQACEAAPAAAAAPSGWPYEEPCSEPLFAALSPQHQFWLISDVVTWLWCQPKDDE